jgi:putative copper resistance protein D
MDEALIACRLIHFASVMVAFGGSAFRFYAVGAGDESTIALLDARTRRLVLISATLALLSGLLLVPLMGSRMAGSAWAALDWDTNSAVLFDTSFGRVWRWHLLLAAVLAVVCTIPKVSVSLAALLLASLGWVGHAAAGQGEIALGHEINQSVHLLAAGIWLGGLVPLGWLVIWARRSPEEAWYVLLADALPQFSHMGYAAVAFVALTGLINTVLLVGSVDALIGTPYGRVLLWKIFLFAGLVAIAAINRLILVPRIHRETIPSTGTTALMWTVGIEQGIGLLLLAVASVLGTLPPGIDAGAHLGMHHH